MEEIITEYGIKNFSIKEITQGQDDIPVEFHSNIIPTICLLQQIRNIIMTPVFIHSTYRNKEYNTKVAGAKNSLHLVFNAIDFTPFEYDYFTLRRLFEQLCNGRFNYEVNWKGKQVKVTPENIGVGLYKTFIHIDTRGLLGRPAPSRWHG
ncbi:MAG: D-Ala-D-Ala carboxypeptidase family metallohydrolase [Bacteroidota bacterium]|nr:D-Ala-D-Ala carboxypeptidase family metallohydrolase [Bacteroidota bacterium]